MASESLIVELDAKTSKLDSKLKTTESNIDKLSKTTSKADKQLDNLSNTGLKLSKTSTAVSSGLSNVGRSAGQAGIQFQQFVGQVQGGQSAFLALSQQAADLGIVLGAPLVGVVVALGASIAGALLPNLLKASEGLKKIEETSKTLIKSYEELSEAQREVARDALVQDIKAQSLVFNELNKEVAELQDELDQISRIEKRTGAGNFLIRAILGGDPQKAQTQLTQAEASLEAQRLKLKGLSDQLNNLFKIDLGQTSEKVKAEAEKLRLIYEGAFAGETLADPAILASIIEGNEAQLELAREFAEEINIIRSGIGQTEAERLVFEVEANRLALEKKLIDEEQFQQQQIALAKKFNKERQADVKNEKNANRAKLASQSAYLAAASTLANTFFEDNKALRTALIIADTAAGIVRQFSDLPYPAALATSAAIAATGIAQLAAVNSSSDSGGGTISAPTATPQQETFTPETSSLDLTTQDEEGITTQRLILTLDDGTELLDGLAKGIEENRRQGR